jgi:calcium-dependent protein kinase
MNQHIAVAPAIVEFNQFVDVPVHELENIITAESMAVVIAESVVILEDTEQDLQQTPELTSSTSESLSTEGIKRKRPPRRSKSFTCSAKDFVPRRTDKFEAHYDLSSLLGEGAFGEVSERAVKIIHKDRMIPSEYELVVNEFQLLRKMDHPNVIRMFEFYDSQDKFYIVQELAEGGELYDELIEYGRLPENETALLMKQVLACLKYLHANGVVHRDLNLENILLESNKDYEGIKIIDFGLAAPFREGEKLSELVGKIHYLAPEVLEQRYGCKYDVWSAGIMAYILLSGFAPFDSDSDAYIRQLIAEGNVSFDDPEWEDVSGEAKDFVAKLLTYDEDSRPTAEEALRHPWIVNAIQQSSETFRNRHSTLAGDALSNLRSFSNNSKLKQAACSFIASQLLHKQEREAIDRIFRGMDGDCDGRLSVEDLQTKYKEFNDSELSDEEISALFAHCDMSGSGFIDYSEFVIASMRPSDLLDEKKLQSCFDHFDVDKSGFISAEALKESLRGCRDDGDVAWTDEVVENIIQQVDRGNGLISFADFKDIMSQDYDATDHTDEDTTDFDSLLSVSDDGREQ